MKKSVLNLGRALNRAEQKQINGGFGFITTPDEHCDRVLVPSGCPCNEYTDCASGVCDGYQGSPNSFSGVCR